MPRGPARADADIQHMGGSNLFLEEFKDRALGRKQVARVAIGMRGPGPAPRCMIGRTDGIEHGELRNTYIHNAGALV